MDLTRNITAGRSQLVKIDLLAQELSPLFPAKFDLVFTDGLFEHFSPAQQDHILQNFMAVLAAGGAIATFVPNRWSPWQIIRPWMMPGIEERPFTLRELLDLNRRNGLQVQAYGGVNTLPFRVSPEGKCAAKFGMLLYCFSTIK